MIGTPKDISNWLLNQDADKYFEIKQHRLKRSLSANSYAWVLISKLADVLRASKDEIYLQMLKRYGQCRVVSVISQVDLDGYFKYYEPFGETVLDGKSFTHYRVYKGSSQYDSKEMSIFIDGLLSEARELEIETLPPYEIERLKNMWETEA